MPKFGDPIMDGESYTAFALRAVKDQAIIEARGEGCVLVRVAPWVLPAVVMYNAAGQRVYMSVAGPDDTGIHDLMLKAEDAGMTVVPTADVEDLKRTLREFTDFVSEHDASLVDAFVFIKNRMSADEAVERGG